MVHRCGAVVCIYVFRLQCRLVLIQLCLLIDERLLCSLQLSFELRHFAGVARFYLGQLRLHCLDCACQLCDFRFKALQLRQACEQKRW